MKNGLKYLFLLTSIVFSNSEIYSQDTLFVDKLIDSAHFYKENDFKKSLKTAKKALVISQDSAYYKREIDAKYILGFLYYQFFNQYDTAYQYIYSAYELSEQKKYKKGVSEYFLLKGNISKSVGNNNQAKFCFNKSLKIAEEIQNHKLMANSFHGLASVQKQQELLMVALNSVNKAIENYVKINDKYGLAESYVLMGLINSDINAYDETEKCFSKSKEIYKELNDFDGMASIEYVRALSYKDREMYDKAIPLFKKLSNTEFEETGIHFKFLSKKMLSEIYGEMGLYEQAYKLQAEFQNFRDSSYSADQFNRINNLQAEFENIIQEKEKENLKRENKLKSKEIKKDKLIIWLTILISLQAVVFLIFIYRKYRQLKITSEELRTKQQLIHDQEKEIERRRNAKIKQSLEYKKRELTVKVFQIFQGNQLNQKLLEKLQSLKLKIKTRGRQGEEIRGDIVDMISEIKFNSNIQIWDEFEVYFNKVTPGFKKWLTNAYPNLTPNEIRLCIFSQLNLKTKEISNITLQSIKSINVARTRLRKKLEIEDPNLSLSSFLHNSFMEQSKETTQQN